MYQGHQLMRNTFPNRYKYSSSFKICFLLTFIIYFLLFFVGEFGSQSGHFSEINITFSCWELKFWSPPWPSVKTTLLKTRSSEMQRIWNGFLVVWNLLLAISPSSCYQNFAHVKGEGGVKMRSGEIPIKPHGGNSDTKRSDRDARRKIWMKRLKGFKDTKLGVARAIFQLDP